MRGMGGLAIVAMIITSCGGGSGSTSTKSQQDLREGYASEPALIGEWRESCLRSGTLPCFILADIYERGEDAPKNIPLAIKYYQMACKQGLYYACDDAKRLQSTR